MGSPLGLQGFCSCEALFRAQRKQAIQQLKALICQLPTAVIMEAGSRELLTQAVVRLWLECQLHVQTFRSSTPLQELFNAG